MHKQRQVLLMMALAAAAATSALGQAVAPLVVLTSSGTASTASVPDFSGIWTHPYFGVGPPLSGPGPVMRRPGRLLVGDSTNPILKPAAAEAVKKHGEIELGGDAAPNPRNQCWPEGVPFVFRNTGMQMLHQPHQITFLYDEDNIVRRVRMNQPHPVPVTASWYGDSVGHYEGDTLVVDTIGIKIGPFAVIDVFGTPRTPALHVIERYRLIDYEAAIEAEERTLPADRGRSDALLPVDPDYKGKGLQLQFTVVDEGVFTMPWSATVTYRRALDEWPEIICAENTREYYAGRDTAVPRADKPDF